MRCIVLIEDIKATAFMRAFDVMEPGKFVGKMLEVEVEGTQTAAAILAKMQEPRSAVDGEDLSDRLKVVAVFIPNGDSAVEPGYKIFSTGTKWISVDAMAKGFGAGPVSQEQTTG